MGLLTKLKSLLGFEEDRSQVRRGESGVTIEREPDESPEPDAEVESTVKGVDEGGEESFDAGATDRAEAETGGSTEDAKTGLDEIEEAETEDAAETEPEGATEPAGAAESSAETADATEAETASEAVEADETEPEAVEEPETTAEPETTEELETPAEPETTDADEEPEAVEESETTEETDAAEATESAEESASAGEPLEDVKGIGPAYAERLREAGVADVAELAQADADRLAEETDLSAKRISSWIERAQAR